MRECVERQRERGKIKMEDESVKESVCRDREKEEESVRECVQRHTERWKTEIEDESVKDSVER